MSRWRERARAVVDAVCADDDGWGPFVVRPGDADTSGPRFIAGRIER